MSLFPEDAVKCILDETDGYKAESSGFVPRSKVLDRLRN